MGSLNFPRRTVTLEFEGYSDDTFGWREVNGTRGDSHDDNGSRSIRTWLVKAAGQRVCVSGVYAEGCNWSIGLWIYEEGDADPEWATGYVWSQGDYSPKFTIEVPSDYSVELIWPETEDDE